MSSYSSLLSLSPIDQIGGEEGDDDMAAAAAVSSYLSFDIDVGEEYYPPEAAAAAASFHWEQQQPAAPLPASLLGGDDHGNGGGESSRQSQLEVGDLSSEALSGHDKIDKGSTRRLPTAKGSKIAFKTRSVVDVMDDGYRWRKYGKKMVKNSPNPRNYYRCSTEGCHVKKRVERERDDARFVITTYDGVHNHPAPLPPRGSLALGQPQEEAAAFFPDMQPHAARHGTV